MWGKSSYKNNHKSILGKVWNCLIFLLWRLKVNILGYGSADDQCHVFQIGVSRKSGWKVKGTWLFGSFGWKNSCRNGLYEMGFLFFRTARSKRKFVFHFLTAISGTNFRLPRDRLSEKWNWFVKMVHTIPGAKCTNRDQLNGFCLPFTQTVTDWFADVNGKPSLFIAA